MALTEPVGERRTTVDEIFERLQDEILDLRLRPGDRISEADVAARFGVSRQPVRDAFSRLANLDLLLIRPQRATEVRRFSMREIVKARFVRTAVEREVLRRAAATCDADDADLLDAALAEQERAAGAGDVATFGGLDRAYHELLCRIARVDFAYDVIRAEKAKVDRLCRLSIDRPDRIAELVADHRAMALALKAGDAEAAMAAGMIHLGRLDDTIARISRTNAGYFEPADG